MTYPLKKDDTIWFLASDNEHFFHTREHAEEAAKRINKLLDEYQKEINKE